jgi:hypothetical protein
VNNKRKTCSSAQDSKHENAAHTAGLPSGPPDNPVDTQGEKDEETEDEYVKADEEGDDSEYYLYRLENLLVLDQRHEVPTLSPQSVFEVARIDQSAVHVTKGEFSSRLQSFLKEDDPAIPWLSAELIEFLFKRAVAAHRRMAVWDRLIKNAQSRELQISRRYLRKELNRFTKIRSLMREEGPTAPSWISEWRRCWIGAFEEIREEIEGELRTANNSLDGFAQLRTSAGLEMESYILWVEQNEIRKEVKGTPFARKLEVIRAAFAYAAKLVPSPRGETAAYKSLIKQRISRITTSSAKQREAYATVLRTMLAMGRTD